MKVRPRQKPMSWPEICPLLQAWVRDTAAEKTTWKPTMAEATMGSIPRQTKVKMMVVLFPFEKSPALNPPKKAPRQMMPQYFQVSRGYQQSQPMVLQYSILLLTYFFMAMRERAQIMVKTTIPITYSFEQLENLTNFPWARRARTAKTIKMTRTAKIWGKWQDSSQAIFSSSSSWKGFQPLVLFATTLSQLLSDFFDSEEEVLALDLSALGESSFFIQVFLLPSLGSSSWLEMMGLTCSESILKVLQGSIFLEASGWYLVISYIYATGQILSFPLPASSCFISSIDSASFFSFSSSSRMRLLNLQKNLMLNMASRMVMRILATTGGRISLRMVPTVDPKRTLGMMIITMLQSTRVVFLVGCLRNINRKKLQRAVPATSGQLRIVASAQEQLRAIMRKTTLNYPKELPVVLHRADAKGKRQQIAMGQPERGKTGSWRHSLLAVSQQYWQGQEKSAPQVTLTISFFLYMPLKMRW